MPTTAEDVCRVANSLPRTEQALVRDRIKFRVRRIVYASLSRDETLMGFAFPRDERAALIASEPDKFLLPVESDMRYNWVRVRLSAVDLQEMGELVLSAWEMVVPKSVAAAHLETLQHFPEGLFGPPSPGNNLPNERTADL
ncbi:MmcQ/YjbR family DNA-binding protein [Streptomyces sp. NPDC096354]|uniref:MmcQ/YjbR family DNA-binding protein n=1 Tax=Streptomyces sp. NPDC096354 TaxID=3366088 RepID=UPI00380FDA96